MKQNHMTDHDDQVRQLSRMCFYFGRDESGIDADLEEIRQTTFGGSFVDHGNGLYYVDATGNPWTATYIQNKDDPLADLAEDMAAEQKARATYNHLIDLSDDPGVIDTLRYLREREIVHFQRFGEAMVQVQEHYACKTAF